ncbi:hypothetical protein ATCC90586_001015 [Pythium insidiosum]|nr:hypothetical protein ATCC90586_001015 [Pythium insidiosum]
MAGDSSASASLFRVGDNVELWRLLFHLSILVAFIVALEQCLHWLQHRLKGKYHEMLTKVYGELMILGFIGLGIKLLKEVAHLNAYGKPMIAFQAADLTVFILAVALILQSIIVFFKLRRKNVQVDKAELISSGYLLDLVAQHTRASGHRASSWAAWCCRRRAVGERLRGPDTRRAISPADFVEVAKMRILRHFFLSSHGLPELFPFSKYLRQAQDNQISHMIEVQVSTWIVLLLCAWAIDSVAQMFIDWNERQEHYAIVLAFLLFSWAAVLLHLAIDVYFRWAIQRLLATASGTSSRDVFTALERIAEEELGQADRELADDAIRVMEQVREEEQLKRAHRHRGHHFLAQDTGFQLVGTIYRNVSSKMLRAGSSGGDGHAAAPAPAHARPRRVHVAFFSRKAWHFVVMSTLMLNGFYLALFCQCVLYQMDDIYDEFGAVPVAIIPLPLLINMVLFQPRILRNFILVSCVTRVDVKALGDVIDHFTETVQLRTEFVHCVNDHLEQHGQKLDDVLAEFAARDVSASGFLDVNELRLALHPFGFKLSFFRFNSVAKLLFQIRGYKVEYAQVLKLLSLGQAEQMRVEYSDALVALLGLNDPVEASLSRQASLGILRSAAALDASSDSSVVIMNRSRDSTGFSAQAHDTRPTPYLSAQSSMMFRSNRSLLRANSNVVRSVYQMDFDSFHTSATATDAWRRADSGAVDANYMRI